LKSARLQVLTTPAFRDWLRREAGKAGVSVGELVRSRCEQRVSDEETVLAELTALLRKEVTATRAAVRRNLDETSAILNELKARRKTDSAEHRA
jgi:chromosome condensin MukBEF complex kleisin-like MukF subunit